MIEIEKAIKGLEEISDYFYSVYRHSEDREEINKAKDRCDAVEDAIALLKEQEPKRGKWIDVWDREDPYTSSEGRCSVCGRISARPLGNFCRWCGAKMREDDYFV